MSTDIYVGKTRSCSLNGKGFTVSQLESSDAKRLTFPAASTDKPKTINNKMNLRVSCIMNRASKRRAQASIEVTLAFICIFILLFGSIKIFIWFTERIVRRQEDYEQTRVLAGSLSKGQTLEQAGANLNESNYPKLDIFGESTD